MINFSRLLPLLAAVIIALTSSLAPLDADAARLGGGKSFGSKPGYSGGYSKSTPDRDAGSSFGQQNNMNRQAMGQPSPSPFSRFGGMGGLMGGLLMGGLLGSLISGGGFAFPGLMDILLIGGGIWLLFRVLRSRRSPEPAVSSAGAGYSMSPAGHGGYGGMDSGRTRAEAGWDGLRSTSAQTTPSSVAPAGFDEAEFLAGAKAAYARLQASWDKRDLDDIRQFASHEVYKEIERQAQDDPKPGRTDILLVEARLLEVRREAGQEIATAFFDVLMREDPNAQSPSQVREVWHFSRDASKPGDSWRLEGIQQLAQ